MTTDKDQALMLVNRQNKTVIKVLAPPKHDLWKLEDLLLDTVYMVTERLKAKKTDNYRLTLADFDAELKSAIKALKYEDFEFLKKKRDEKFFITVIHQHYPHWHTEFNFSVDIENI